MTQPHTHLDYGLIGNGQINALISKTGSIDWLCMPSFDSPFVFDRILDAENGGYFAIEPVDKDAYTIHQAYEKNSNALITTFESPTTAFKITDFMPRWDIWDGHKSHTPVELYRYVEILVGEPEVNLIFQPANGYLPTKNPCIAINATTLKCEHMDEAVFLVSDIQPEQIMGKHSVRLKASCFFGLSYGHPIHDVSLGTVKEKLERTNLYWHRWVKNCYLPDEYQSEIIRSALTLKQLVYEPTGAVIAAPTTSIPEILGGNRNWDYRFCWIRDSFFIVNALLKISKFEESESYISYLTQIILEMTVYLKPLYTIDGHDVPPVTRLDHLAGFDHSQPVRIGNDATFHIQTDAYGEAVLSMYPLFFDERVIRKDWDLLWQCIEKLVTYAIAKFPEKDNGIWEIGGHPAHYTFSKLMCWVAVDRGCKIAYKLKNLTVYRRWNKVRNGMRQQILEQAWSEEKQAFTQAYGSQALDASTLLMSTLGFIDPKDPRMVSTIARTEEELKVDGLLFRYTNEDELGLPENAFTICTFWLIDALILSGQKRKARKYFEELLTFGNHLGLFAEHINPITHEMTGNFPQGYTHVAIITSAMLLAQN